MSLARRVTVDDSFLGYHIPKDATAMINVWAIHHDPENYYRPEDFDPERFMRNPLGTKHDEISTHQESRIPLYVFGAGRRACPGEQFAMNTIRLAFAQLMRSYDVETDEELDMSIETGFIASFLLMSRPFKVRIVPRNEMARMVVKDEYKKATEFLTRAIA